MGNRRTIDKLYNIYIWRDLIFRYFPRDMIFHSYCMSTVPHKNMMMSTFGDARKRADLYTSRCPHSVTQFSGDI
jgi:hypothetical protein